MGGILSQMLSDSICPSCEINTIERGRKTCRTCRGRSYSDYRQFKKDCCEWPGCTFEIEHPSQLDVDHLDGDRSNVNQDNFVTLCANHHRLKTILNRDAVNKRYRKAIINV